MFNKNFYPTPPHVIDMMMMGENVTGKVILEPSAGAGAIVDVLKQHGAMEVLTCENHPDLKTIIAQKSKMIADDFMNVTGDMVSHVDLIFMNPPFSADEKHIIHAWNLAPPGCRVIALCNINTIENKYTAARQEMGNIIDMHGNYENLGECFAHADRTTNATIALIKLQKPASDRDAEFSGFFMDEEIEAQENGIMHYNVIRDLVNRYVAACRIYDEQLAAAQKMNAITSGFYSSSLSMSITEDGKPKAKNDFKKDLQKSGWTFIFNKLNMKKYTTRGLKEDINKFIEKQTEIPFTMRNIYHMLTIIAGTQSQRMDKAVIEVFDKLTMHYDENRYSVEGWKTNSHYLINRRFIMPSMVGIGWSGQIDRPSWSNSNFDLIEDMVKATCYITGDNYSNMISLEDFITRKYKLVDEKGNYINNPSYDHDVTLCENKSESLEYWLEKIPGSKIVCSDLQWGKWFEWGYFRCRAYKKGTMHFEFKTEDLWAQFNQRVTKIKGFPLYEHTRRDERKPKPAATVRNNNRPSQPHSTHTIISTIKLKSNAITN